MQMHLQGILHLYLQYCHSPRIAPVVLSSLQDHLRGILHLDLQYIRCTNLAPEVWDHYIATSARLREIFLLNIEKVHQLSN